MKKNNRPFFTKIGYNKNIIDVNLVHARITQLEEYLLYTQEVIGSSPIAGTISLITLKEN
jgi:hypothetical protein